MKVLLVQLCVFFVEKLSYLDSFVKFDFEWFFFSHFTMKMSFANMLGLQYITNYLPNHLSHLYESSHERVTQYILEWHIITPLSHEANMACYCKGSSSLTTLYYVFHEALRSFNTFGFFLLDSYDFEGCFVTYISKYRLLEFCSYPINFAINRSILGQFFCPFSILFV